MGRFTRVGFTPPEFNRLAFHRSPWAAEGGAVETPAPSATDIPGCRVGSGRYIDRYDYSGRGSFPVYKEEDVYLLDADWAYHIYVIGQTGGGKSNLILNLLGRDQAADAGFLVIDSDGQLTRNIVARTNGEHLERLLLVELDPARPLGVNFFDCADPEDDLAAQRTATRFVNIFRKIWGGSAWSERVEDMLENLAYVFVANPGANLSLVPDFLTKPGVRRRMLRRVDNPQVRGYWEGFESYTDIQKRDRIEVAERKIRKWLRVGTLRAMLSAPVTTVDLRRALAEGWQVILHLPAAELGEDVLSLVGAYFIELLLEATLERVRLPESVWHPFHIYADEYQMLCTPTTADFLKRTRKYNVGLLIAHQTRHPDLDAENLSATLQVGTTIAMASDPRSMQDVSSRFLDTDSRELANLPRFHAKVRLAHTTRQYTVKLDKADKPRWEEWETAQHLEAIRERSRAAFRWEPEKPEVGADVPEVPEVGVYLEEEPIRPGVVLPDEV